jgi:hypothetical protein
LCGNRLIGVKHRSSLVKKIMPTNVTVAGDGESNYSIKLQLNLHIMHSGINVYFPLGGWKSYLFSQDFQYLNSRIKVLKRVGRFRILFVFCNIIETTNPTQLWQSHKTPGRKQKRNLPKR